MPTHSTDDLSPRHGVSVAEAQGTRQFPWPPVEDLCRSIAAELRRRDLDPRDLPDEVQAAIAEAVVRVGRQFELPIEVGGVAKPVPEITSAMLKEALERINRRHGHDLRKLAK